MTDLTYFINGKRHWAGSDYFAPNRRRDLDDLETPGRPTDVLADRDRPGSAYTPALCMQRENDQGSYDPAGMFTQVLIAMFPHDHYVLRFGGLNEGWLYPEDLDVSFDGFDWDQYGTSEWEVLTPQLHDWGFREIKWGPGETDSFGPLSRVATMRDQDGSIVRFCYG